LLRYICPQSRSYHPAPTELMIEKKTVLSCFAEKILKR